MVARNYTNLHSQTTLSSSISSGATTITLTSNAGLPVAYPFSLAIDYGQSNVEVVTVTGPAGGSFTVTRGEDGTSAQSHNAGAVVVHPCTARDLAEPQAHIYASSNVHGIGSSASVVGTDTTQTLTNKTVSGSANTLTNIGDSSITSLAASKITGTFTSVTASGTVQGGTVTSTGALNGASAAVSGNATVGGTLGVTGATTMAAVGATSVTASGTVQGATVTATGAVNGASAAISGNATVGGTLGVTGATTLTGGVNGAVAATGAVSGTNITGTGTVQGATVNGTSDVKVNSVSVSRGIIGGKSYTGTGNIVAGVGTSDTALSMDSGAVNIKNGRRYRISICANIVTSTNNVSASIRLRDGTTTGGTLLKLFVTPPTLQNGPTYPLQRVYEFDCGADATKTYGLTGNISSGVMNVDKDSNGQAFVTVEDVGPSGVVAAG